MRNRDEFSEMRETWCGLNRPELVEEQADVVVFGITYDGSVSFRSGAAEGPDVLRKHTVRSTPCNEDLDYFDHLKVVDGGDFRGTDRDIIFSEVEEYVEGLVKAGKRFTMIGGDHSVTIPVYKGIDKAIDEELGIIHIGAHPDLCQQIDEDIYSHRCTQRRAMELNHVSGAENFYFIGVRSLERDEFDILKGGEFNIKTSADCFREGPDAVAADCIEKMKSFKKIYLTIDIDSLDPGFAGGTGAPKFGGISPRIMLGLIKPIFEKLNIIGFDVVEIAPSLDPSLSAVFAGRRIISQCWSFWAESLGKLEKIKND